MFDHRRWRLQQTLGVACGNANCRKMATNSPRHRGQPPASRHQQVNKIENRLFLIQQEWREAALVSYRVIVELISATTKKPAARPPPPPHPAL